jgi:hypothetical protein
LRGHAKKHFPSYQYILWQPMLKFEREYLANELKIAKDIISNAQSNSAVRLKEIQIPF